MALIVDKLLQRSVPVFLITGRGRASTRKAAQQIKKYSALSDYYLRRLQCITHNGVFQLWTPANDPSAFLSEENLIGSAPSEGKILHLINTVREVITDIGLQSDKVEVTREPQSIRLVFQSVEERTSLEDALHPLILKLYNNGTELHMSRGSYADLSCLDLAWTNKKKALEHIAMLIGVSPQKILRIGDQGQEGGNDFDLLDSPAGFSVGEMSSSLTTCYPVLTEDLQRQSYGAEATEWLLKTVLLFPPLSITPKPSAKHLTALRNFERLAISRSRKETETMTQRLRIRLRYLLPSSDGFGDPQTIELSDIYDQLSGGVKFRDWELDSLADDHLARKLFDIPVPQIEASKEPCSKWCLYTDTGILMRGPNYYFGLTRKRSETTLVQYLEITKQFIVEAEKVVVVILEEDVDLTRYKLVLAIQDNVRNILLQLFYIAFVVEGLSTTPDYELTRQIFIDAVSPHTLVHFNFLLNELDTDWSKSLLNYRILLRQLKELIEKLSDSLVELTENQQITEDLFKWRECDYFLQNITAVQLGLHELRQRKEIRNLNRVTAIGLAYGGIELPAIAKVVAETRGFELDVAIAKVSIYGDRKVGEKIRAGEHDYVSGLLQETKPLCLLNAPKGSIEDTAFILMDDNCTTCVTLQLARDFLVMLGADVVGAIVVRFPGTNRHVQMAMPGHGSPDPEVLFSFIRGLVAPSPYTRLIQPASGSNPYLDQTNMFDKAKKRIGRYLQKNGTPVIKDM